METPEEHRNRVTALVEAKWPNPLEPNVFVNTILDIIRGEWFAREDVIEAIDALAWKNLPGARTWGKPTNPG